MKTIKNIKNHYGIWQGSTLDIFIISVSKNPKHFRFDELKTKYPDYFTAPINNDAL